jgi:murein DD-endopeptidase MepM/ murein hydrolase activator NlpD
LRRLSFVVLVTVLGSAFLLPNAHSFMATGKAPRSGHMVRPVNGTSKALHMPGHEKIDQDEADEPGRLAAHMPIVGKQVTSVFGWRTHPIFHRKIFHDGVDFDAESGDAVHVVLDGVVRSAESHRGYGNAVLVYHPASQTTSMYAHLSKLCVKEGQTVRRGTVIGLAGCTGYATGVHLHFGVKADDGSWIDPLAFLKSVPAEAEMLALRALDGATKSGDADDES